MAKDVTLPAGQVEISVYQADDGVGVFKDGTEILHVDFMQSGSTLFELSKGQSVDLRFEIYNLTGFNYNAVIIINAGGKRIYEAKPRGMTPPGWNIAWSDGFTIHAV